MPFYIYWLHPNYPAHNEYSRCLRAILNFYKGDLIIILDEIDALKSINYSDNIFAQIRSNYFSRTNFPVFERLTYILSGVIEPTELIKDRNKSPFNIGDKIYLDDFTKEEHNIFIEKSKLKLSKEVSDEIFDWTSGNPRLTFDICSEVENFLLEQKTINKESIYNIVKKKYLTNYDVAPIDHIRELVKKDRIIRESIKAIHNRNVKELSDEIKKKLYLFGIISSKFDEETVIKNKIIEQTLSEEWLKSIDKSKEISLVYGLIKYDERNFKEAIEILMDVISNPKSSKSDIESSIYFTGLSYYKLRDFKEAINYFSNNGISKLHVNDAKSFLGMCKIAIGEKDQGIRILEESVKIESYNHAYYNALINLAISIEDKQRKYELFDKLFNSTFLSKDEKIEELDEFRRLALYYQQELLVEEGKIEEALEKNKLAIGYSNHSDSLYLYYSRYYLLDKKDESIKTLIVNLIINNDLEFDNTSISRLSFTESSLLLYLNLIFDKYDNNLFERLIDYSLLKLLKNSKKYEIVYGVFIVSTTNRTDLLEYILNGKEEIIENDLIAIYRGLLQFLSEDHYKYSSIFNKYLNLFIKTNCSHMRIYIHFLLILDYITYLIDF